MRQRITYLLRDADSFSPDQLQLRGRALAVDGLDAAKEVRLKRALDGRDGRDGAAVLSRLSRACSELYIRWTAATGEPPPPSPLDYPAPAGLLVVCLPSGSFQP